MIPKSLSATSVSVFEDCPARWVAEFFLRAPQPSTTHADLGTAVHGALERFVKGNFHHKHADNYSVLVALFTEEYEKLFTDPSRYQEGLEMLERWWNRQDWKGRSVLSTEQKTSFTLKTTAGEIPFNYIWDRCDLVEAPVATETWIEIIDYKTVSRPIQASDLRNKIQARCYGLAGQIAYPNADKIWVTFDLLRYEPVGTVFTRDDNIATWKYVRRVAERILAIPDSDDAPERLNAQCRWCVRKQACKTLRDHTAVGGVLGITDPGEAASRRFLLENQKRAIDSAISELDGFILDWFEREEELGFETDLLKVNVTARKTREIDSERAVHIIGPGLLTEYGKLGVTAVDKLLKDKRLTDEQRAELKTLVRHRFSEPRVVVTPKNPIDED